MRTSTFGTTQIRETVSHTYISSTIKKYKINYIEFNFEHFKYTTERFNTAMVDNKLTRDDID